MPKLLNEAERAAPGLGEVQSPGAGPYLPRDFVETEEGLLFAVVDGRLEHGRVLGFLRYIRHQDGLRKVATSEAMAYLAGIAPEYQFYSSRLQVELHGVPVSRISHHYQPGRRTRALLAGPEWDRTEQKAFRLLRLLESKGLDLQMVGITGSLLIGAHTGMSDLDLIIYDRRAFHHARQIVRTELATGELTSLDEAAWRDAYERRGCALSFVEYLWHERRKLNKALIAGTKFDITLQAGETHALADTKRKLGARTIRARVRDAAGAFDYPARYTLDHAEIGEALAFTHTYAGQAESGEVVEIAGTVEETGAGALRIVIGSSREAPGEFIKVAGAQERHS